MNDSKLNHSKAPILPFTSLPSQLPRHPLLARLVQLPGLETLFPKLAEKLSSEGGCEPRRLADQGRRMAEECSFQRTRFLRAKVVKNALDDVILDFDQREASEPQSSEETRAMNKLKECITNAELHDYLHLLGSSAPGGADLLGLTSADLQSKPLPSHSQVFILQRLEEFLFEECFSLLNQLEHHNEAVISTKEKFSRVQQLPEMIRAEVESVKSRREEISEGEAEFQGDWKRLEALMKNFELLEVLAIKHRMGIQADVDSTDANYLSVKCKTLELKIRCLELEILASTYKPDALLALKKIRQQLTSRISKTQTDIEKTKATLQQYEAVGTSFESVVNEYGKIRTEIEGKKWALEELKKTA